MKPGSGERSGAEQCEKKLDKITVKQLLTHGSFSERAGIRSREGRGYFSSVRSNKLEAGAVVGGGRAGMKRWRGKEEAA